MSKEIAEKFEQALKLGRDVVSTTVKVLRFDSLTDVQIFSELAFIYYGVVGSFSDSDKEGLNYINFHSKALYETCVGMNKSYLSSVMPKALLDVAFEVLQPNQVVNEDEDFRKSYMNISAIRLINDERFYEGLEEMKQEG